MRYDDHRLTEMLAREYVLGTLAGRARRRFESLCEARPDMRRSVREWEARLTPLALGLRPLAPPTRVWKQVQLRLGFRRAMQGRIWRALAAVLAVAVIGLVALLLRPPSDAGPQYLAIVHDAERRPVWLLRVFATDGSLRAQTVGEGQPPAGRDHELWLLPTDGTAPVSLGLLPVAGTLVVSLSREQLAGLAGSTTLAVSLEPTGGSPTGSPTGPVIATAQLLYTES